MGSTTSSTSAAITALPASIEPPGPKPSRPGPRSPAWPLGHRPSWDRPSCALSRPEPIKLTVPLRFHPRCWYRGGDDDPRDRARDAWPALIAAVTDLCGAIRGVASHLA